MKFSFQDVFRLNDEARGPAGAFFFLDICFANLLTKPTD